MSDILLQPLEWHTEKRQVKDLVPFEYNPRILTEEKKAKLIKSLEKFNLAEIPAVNTDNKIIAGHQRVKVMMELGRGDELIDVRLPNRELTEQEFKEYNITSNIPTGYWDVDVLEEIFSDIDLAALGLDVSAIEIPDSLIPEDLKKEEEEPFEPELPTEPISAVGDVYEFVSIQKEIKHRLVCGDSTAEDDLLKVLKEEVVDLVITDPPYNVDYTGDKSNPRERIKNDKQSNDSFYNFLLSFYKNTYNHCKPGAAIYVFHADTEGINFRSALIKAGFKFSQCLIWKKNSIVLSRQDYHWIHEPCLYGWKEGEAHNWYSDRKQSTVLEFDRPIRSDEHPTMKPVDLISYLITNSSKQKNIVFDGFVGSGTTLIACEKLWRNARVIELDPKYVDVNVKRYAKYMNDNNRAFEVYRNGELLSKEALNEYSRE